MRKFTHPVIIAAHVSERKKRNELVATTSDVEDYGSTRPRGLVFTCRPIPRWPFLCTYIYSQHWLKYWIEHFTFFNKQINSLFIAKRTKFEHKPETLVQCICIQMFIKSCDNDNDNRFICNARPPAHNTNI